MKKGILRVALILAMALGQQAVYADGGHYVPRSKAPQSPESMIGEMRANQKTGLIDPALMLAAAKNAANETRDEGALYWTNMGPNNVGGQTTAVLYDNQNPTVAYIGSKGGGVYKTVNQGITWKCVGDMPLMVSTMVQDANGVIYVGTGDGMDAQRFNGMGAQSFNGMNGLGYANSFIGSGIYKIENDVITRIESTNPSSLNQVEDWSFVNELAISGDKLIAATNAGLRYTSDGGQTWNYAKKSDGSDMTMRIDEVKVASDGTVMVAAREKVGSSTAGTLYIGTLESLVLNEGTDVNPSGFFDIAIAPSDPNTMYAAAVESSGVHSGFYYSTNKGQSWYNVLPISDYVQIYEGFGMNNHGLYVHPTDPTRLFVMGYNLWELKKESSEEGNFIAKKLTDGTSNAIYVELHVGLHCLAYNPNNANEFYVGTDGGIFKLTRKVYSTYDSYVVNNCNRNYIASRFFSVAYSAYKQRIVGGSLDHGSVLIVGDPNNVSLESGTQVYPNSSFAFSSEYYAGYCALSLLNPNALFVTTAGNNVFRSQTMGADYDMSNFTSNLSISSSQEMFRMPILLAENFNDTRSTDSVWFFSRSNAYTQGEVVKCRSNIGEYPFDYTLPYDLGENDSIQVKDPFSAVFFLAVNGNIYMNRTPLHFNKLAEWSVIAKSATGFSGMPTSLALSSDQDNLFVGTKGGILYRISNINEAYDEVTDIVTTKIELTNGEGVAISQCITSVAVDPNDANKVLVTLGNYGNTTYVMYSDNALSEEPVFTVKQGDLPLMPVYSSVIEMSTGKVIIGTEHGIYMTNDISASSPTWMAQRDPMGDVPVMELKQQTIDLPTQTFVEYGHEITVEGTTNQGVIYAATYGRGLYRCDNFILNSPVNVKEVAAKEVNMSIYPNPTHESAKVMFELEKSAYVTYQVYDLTGKMMQSVVVGNCAEGKHEVSLSVNGFATGSYILRLNQGDKSSVTKFLVY